MEYTYGIYGIAVSSDFAFDYPVQQPAGAAVGARVAFTRASDHDFPAAGAEASDEWFTCDERVDGSIYLRWSRYFEFLVEGCGTRVKYRSLADGDDTVLQNFLFGQALSFALVRQGIEPVHAAVVERDGRAVALLGECGYGKSTLAGALVRSGWRLLSDDVLVVYREEARIMAAAGAGRIKLRPDSARAFARAPHDGVRLNPHADKRVFRLDEVEIQRRDVPLAGFVALPSPDERDRSEGIEIHSMSRAELFYELVKNTFVRPLQQADRLRQNFSCNAQLASEVPGYRVSYPAGIDRLPAVCDALLERFVHRLKGGLQ